MRFESSPPVRDEGQDPVEFDAGSKRKSGGSMGAEREVPKWMSVVLAGTAFATKRGADYTPVMWTPKKADE